MFAVPGWSVSPELLKTETESSKSQKKRAKKRKKDGPDGENGVPPKRQRIRQDVPANSSERKAVNASNRRISEERHQSRDRPEKGKSGRRQDGPRDIEKKQISRQTSASKSQDSPLAARVDSRTYTLSNTSSHQQTGLITADHPTSADTKLVNPGYENLTPLQSKMRIKLMGSRFRHLNEALYTKPSAESLELFNMNPGFFDEYHVGFRQQVSTWPQNPVETLCKEIEHRSQVAGREKGANETSHVEPLAGGRPLPRTHGLCRIADLGCGDASLAKKVQLLGKQARLAVDSYDLQSTVPGVIKADISNLPTKDDSVNIAVFCLALMGTNWIEFIEEAWRILHWKGELWIAEIKSRFSSKQRRPPAHSVGKKRKPDKQEMKKQRQKEEQEEAEKTIAEMDGSTQSSNTTDVSAFITVLRKRGFDLADDQSTDFSNKMFVRMRFVKNRPPVKGKYEGRGAKKQNWREMLREGMDDDQDEADVLRPCLYKIR